jgi:hypothetical protein
MLLAANADLLRFLRSGVKCIYITTCLKNAVPFKSKKHNFVKTTLNNGFLSIFIMIVFFFYEVHTANNTLITIKNYRIITVTIFRYKYISSISKLKTDLKRKYDYFYDVC